MPALNHRGQYVAPQNTMALMDALGATRAARTLGVSTTLLYTARKEGEVSKVVEKAAEGALRSPLAKTNKTPEPKLPAERDDTVVCLLEVKRSKLAIVQKLAQQLHAPIMID